MRSIDPFASWMQSPGWRVCRQGRSTSDLPFGAVSAYTGAVDKVRLGRALGYGTRHAAKTLAAVAEAATAPDPQASRQAPSSATPHQAQAQSQTGTAPPTAGPRTRVKIPSAVPSAAQLRGAGRSMWGPLAAYSGALWLRVTGLFFAVLAMAMASGAWRQRGILRNPAASTENLHHLWVFVGFAALFGYFAISSFLRANLRERRAVRRAA